MIKCSGISLKRSSITLVSTYRGYTKYTLFHSIIVVVFMNNQYQSKVNLLMTSRSNLKYDKLNREQREKSKADKWRIKFFSSFNAVLHNLLSMYSFLFKNSL